MNDDLTYCFLIATAAYGHRVGLIWIWTCGRGSGKGKLHPLLFSGRYKLPRMAMTKTKHTHRYSPLEQFDRWQDSAGYNRRRSSLI